MRQLVLLLATGQGGDPPMFPEVMGSLRVPRRGPGALEQNRSGRWPTRPTPPTRTGSSLVRRGGLRKMQRDRAMPRKHHTEARHRNTLLQTRHHLARRNRPESNHTPAHSLRRHARGAWRWLFWRKRCHRTGRGNPCKRELCRRREGGISPVARTFLTPPELVLRQHGLRCGASPSISRVDAVPWPRPVHCSACCEN